MLFQNYYVKFTTLLILIIRIKANSPVSSVNSELEPNKKKFYFATRINNKEIKFNYQHLNEDLYSIIKINKR